MGPKEDGHDLIVTIVPRGAAEQALAASREAGAEGGTITYGRGVGIHENRKIMGVPIEPEKEILFTVVPRSMSGSVLDSIVTAAHLDIPGNGIAFVLSLERVVGICHAESCPEEYIDPE